MKMNDAAQEWIAIGVMWFLISAGLGTCTSLERLTRCGNEQKGAEVKP